MRKQKRLFAGSCDIQFLIQYNYSLKDILRRKMLPLKLLDEIKSDLLQIDDTGNIISFNAVGGGCIHRAGCLMTSQNKYFLKWNKAAFSGQFKVEAEGLRLLNETKTIRIPDVIGISQTESNISAYLLMEWIEQQGRARPAQQLLGEKLARLHLYSQESGQMKYGLDFDNYIGSTPQINDWENDWIIFFQRNRLAPQI
ncbi:MAG: fructosamine kinase family protein, partial [Anaerolineaceae bacterium]|nr:fructosamine kinase family protein [Anaerolineaceae bacterium]